MLTEKYLYKLFYQLIFLFMKTEMNAQNKLRGKSMISTEISLYKTYYIKGMDKCNIVLSSLKLNVFNIL